MQEKEIQAKKSRSETRKGKAGQDEFYKTFCGLFAEKSRGEGKCYGALAMCMIGCAGPPTPSKIRMYHTLVAAPAFLAIFTIGPSATVLR